MSNTHDRPMTRPSGTPPRAVPTLAVPVEAASDTAAPRLPTIVVSSWKGGVWKTCLSASIAERLAFAGLDLLYLVTDDQLDARRRLGISESDPDVARVGRGSGSGAAVGWRSGVDGDTAGATVHGVAGSVPGAGGGTVARRESPSTAGSSRASLCASAGSPRTPGGRSAAGAPRSTSPEGSPNGSGTGSTAAG